MLRKIQSKCCVNEMYEAEFSNVCIVCGVVKSCNEKKKCEMKFDRLFDDCVH